MSWPINNKVASLVLLPLCLSVILQIQCASRGLEGLSRRVEGFNLENGMRVLLIPRPGAPVFSAYLRIKVGNIEESAGASGLAHFFEHMAFKGTPRIGTKDYEGEKEILEKIHEKGSRLDDEIAMGSPPSVINSLRQELSQLQDRHRLIIEENEFIRIYQRNGGSNINATTSNDFTSYFVSLPVSKLELWAYLESERLFDPVFREFYKERDVVAEERRMRYDNDPDGRLYEALLSEAFDLSPYGINVIGIPSEIQKYTVEVASAFRDRYYIPSRMVLGLVGSFDQSEARRIIKKYFGRLPARDDPGVKIFRETLSDFPREKIITGLDEPRFYLAFHRPAHPHPDDEVFDVLQEFLCGGRTSRLFRHLVQEKRMAARVDCYAAIPGSRLDSLFAFYAVPLRSFSNREIWQEVIHEIEGIDKNPATEPELEKVRNRIDSDLIWSLKSNMGLASLLTYFESISGDWRYLYRLQKRTREIKATDLQRVVREYFVPERRVTIFMEKVKK